MVLALLGPSPWAPYGGHTYYSQTCLSGHLSIAANLSIVTTKFIPVEAHYLYKNLYIAATCPIKATFFVSLGWSL